LQRIRRQFETQVAAIIQRTGHFGFSCGARDTTAPNFAIFGQGEGNVLDGFFAAHDGGSIHHRIDVGDIPIAAANVVVSGEPIADLLAGGVGVFQQQRVGRDHKPRCADATLGDAVEDEGLLDGMQFTRATDAFHGENGGFVRHFLHFDQTGERQFVIEDYRAGTALPLVTTVLHVGQQKLLAQNIHQRCIFIRNDNATDTVDPQDLFIHLYLLI